MKLNDDTNEIAKQVKLLVLDVDGVLTDGGIYFDDSGNELKKFNALDGHGIKMLLSSGFEVAVISSRSTPSVAHRMEGLGVKHYYQGQSDKNIKMQQILGTLSLNVDQVAFIGDDVMDLTVMKKIALPIAVANAHPFVKEHALLFTENRGGNGAVREVCDCLLKAHSKYDDLMKSYL